MKLVRDSFGEAQEAAGDGYEDKYQWAVNIFADSFS
jgi:hypothetical protein